MRLLLAAAVAWLALPTRTAPPLPDLVQQPPVLSGVVQVDGRWRLGFTSAVANEGPGELLVVGSRPSRSAPTMTARQIVGGRPAGAVGTLAFAHNSTHNHWHLLPFETYELRAGAVGKLVSRARKAGFCISDDRPLPGAGPARHVARCGLGRPDLLQVREGLSPDWVDVYGPQREGQFVDITGLRAGLYVLVNRVNADGAIRETDGENDVAGAIFGLSWPEGPDAPPALTPEGTCSGARVCALAGVPTSP